jgi:hypothetical protein
MYLFKQLKKWPFLVTPQIPLNYCKTKALPNVLFELLLKTEWTLLCWKNTWASNLHYKYI